MIVFPFAEYARLLGPLKPVVEEGKFEIGRFENGELFVSLLTPVRMAHCVVLGSIAPPEERFVSLALLAHTLKKEGSCKVTAFLP